jgi:hypothetical protein
MLRDSVEFGGLKFILEQQEDQGRRGYAFERAFDVVIKFGFLDFFQNDAFLHLDGNLNLGDLREVSSSFLSQKAQSGNSGGASDISQKSRDSGHYIFISSKFPKTAE